jgi:NAD(P)-dependent dehydrogenase (short-subunit alcohol dehydrogenase family)
VKQLLKAGHVVIATARTATPSTAISKLVSENDDRLIILTCDLSSADSVKQFGLELEKRSSSVDVLINNAGKHHLSCIPLTRGISRIDMTRNRHNHIHP